MIIIYPPIEVDEKVVENLKNLPTSLDKEEKDEQKINILEAAKTDKMGQDTEILRKSILDTSIDQGYKFTELFMRIFFN